MKNWISLLLLSVAVFSCAGERPNVVVILTDDQGFGDLSFNGNAVLKTPHLDSLAKEGAWLKNFYVSPVCSPTRSSLMTGRYTYRTGVVDTYIGRSMMHADEVTLAETLRASGYRTGSSASGIWATIILCALRTRVLKKRWSFEEAESGSLLIRPAGSVTTIRFCSTMAS